MEILIVITQYLFLLASQQHWGVLILRRTRGGMCGWGAATHFVHGVLIDGELA